jgi:hypothetical protein
MNTLRVKTVIECNVCGCNLKRITSISVLASEADKAKEEASAKILKWKQSLQGKTCKVCTSIVKDLAK